MHSKEQAKKIYEICVANAQAGTRVSYGNVLDSLGYQPRARGHVIRYGLELTLIACAYSKLPILTCIVVTEETGQPAEGGHPLGNLKNDQQRVFNHHEWPPLDAIDWDYVWKNRRELSDTYGTKGYWTNRQSGRRQGKGFPPKQ
jgi:hypothetical protein